MTSYRSGKLSERLCLLRGFPDRRVVGAFAQFVLEHSGRETTPPSPTSDYLCALLRVPRSGWITSKPSIHSCTTGFRQRWQVTGYRNPTALRRARDTVRTGSTSTLDRLNEAAGENPARAVVGRREALPKGENADWPPTKTASPIPRDREYRMTAGIIRDTGIDTGSSERFACRRVCNGRNFPEQWKNEEERVMPEMTVAVPDVTEEFDVSCSECGSTLKVKVTDKTSRIPAQVEVDPCEKCLEIARAGTESQ